MAEYSRLQVKISSETEDWGNVGFGTDDYKVPTIIYANTVKDGSGTDYVPLVDSDGHLQIDVLSGGSGGTLVIDNEAVNAADTGQLVLGTDGANYQILSVDSSGHLQVDVLTGGGAGTQYSDGDANADPTGTVAMGTDGANIFALTTDASGHLQVDVLSGGGAGVQYTEGDTDASITGNALMWEDAADTLVVASATKPLPVEITDASVAVTGTFFQATQPVSIAQDIMLGTDFSNVFGAASLISATPAVKVEEQGTVTVTATNLDIRDLTSVSDSVSAVQSGAWAVTANAGTNLNTSLLALETGGNLATIAGDTTAIQTAVELLDDVVYAEDAGHTTGDKGVFILGVRNEGADDFSGVDKDYIPIALDAKGHVFVRNSDETFAVDTELTTADLDTGAGTDTRAVVGLVGSASGGGALIPGSATDGLLVNLGTNNDVVVSATNLDIRDLTSTDVVTVTGGAGQTADVKVTLDSESVAVTNAGITTIAGAVAGTEMQVDIVAVTPDLMLGTDFSNVLGTVSLILATQADDVVNTTDTLLTSAFGYAFDGTTWDRMRGDATNGLLVNLGANNDITLATLPDTAATDLALQTADLDTIAGDTTAIQTATELIDDTVYVDDADWTADTSKNLLVGGVTQATPSANTDGDVTPLITNSLRELRVAYPESDLAAASTTHVKKYYTSAGAATDGIIWSPAAGKRWYLTMLYIQISAAATVTIEDDLAGGDSAVLKSEFAANSGVIIPFPTPMFSGEDAADLTITTSAGNVYVTAVGYEI